MRRMIALTACVFLSSTAAAQRSTDTDPTQTRPDPGIERTIKSGKASSSATSNTAGPGSAASGRGNAATSGSSSGPSAEREHMRNNTTRNADEIDNTARSSAIGGGNGVSSTGNARTGGASGASSSGTSGGSSSR